MAAKVVTFPLYVGRKDSIDPKLAPMGVLATCKNLRVRKDGRLSCRHGYEALNMLSGPSVVFDLVEYEGRLAAMSAGGAAETASGYAKRITEYTAVNLSGQRWRAETFDQELTPFFGLRDVSVASPPSSGVDELDCAIGGGFVCTIVCSVDGEVQAIVVRESDNQPIVTQSLTSTQSVKHARVTFAVDTFYVAGTLSDNSIRVLSFTPGSSSGFGLLVAAFTSDAVAPTVDIVPVANPTTGRFVIARDRGTATSLTIRVYDSAGLAVGSDITLGGTDTTSLSIAADQTADRIHLALVVTGGAGSLRTYNFAGTLLLGSTATTSGTHSTCVRIPAPDGGAAQVAVATATSVGDTSVQIFSEAAHVATSSQTVFAAVVTTRLVNWTPSTGGGVTDRYQVIFGAYIAPNIASTTSATNALFYWTSGSARHMATRDFVRSVPRSFRNVGLHVDASTGRVVWGALRDSGTGSAMPAVTTLDFHSYQRRQTARFGRLLYIAGAPIQAYDGRCLSEPFQEVPGIVSATPSNGAGTLTSLASYSYVLHWEKTLADGSLWLSPPSVPFDVTMGASDDTVTLVVGVPHDLGVSLGAASYGAEVTVVVSRTSFSGGVPGSIYRRAVTDNAPATAGVYGQAITILDTMPDATLDVQEALYTQAARGPLSGCLEHNAPRAGAYVAASESRLYVSGQLRDNGFQASKEAFLEEPFTFSEFSTFFGQVAGRVRGLYSLDGVRLLFTADEIYGVPGAGPDDLGGGQLESPVRIPSPSGLEDWRSLIEEPEGLWFQLDDGKLYLMPRGGGAPAWAGIDIQDTLASYPVITAACKSRRDDALLFACQNTSAGTDARIAVRSLRTGIWTEDTPPLTASEGIEAMCSLGDAVAYASGGAVYLQSTTSFADGASTVIVTQLKTHPLYPFGVNGYGLIHDLLIEGEYRSAGTLALRVSYDDGVSFATQASFVLTGLTAGQTVQRKWALPVVGSRSIIAEWTYTPSSAGEGFIGKSGALLVSPDEGLPQLLPSECA